MKRKYNILHFPIRNTNGGITRTAMRFLKYIDHDRFQLDFATCSPKLDFEQDIINQGAKVHYVSCYAEQYPDRFRNEFKEILINGDYDAVHLNTNWWKSFEAERAAREAGVKMILVHAHNVAVDIGDDEQRKKEIEVHEKYKREFSEEIATHFLACSNPAADFLFGPQIPREKIQILHPALELDRYTYDEKKRKKIREQLNATNKFVIGNVGRMAYQKNLRFLIECFYEVQKKDERAVLLLVGDGYLETELRNVVKRHDIEEKVIFTGAVDNVEDYMQAMDIFAFPTLFEGLGIVVVEAQAVGLKCLCSTGVPQEAKLTDNVEFLEFDKDKWVAGMLKYSNGYTRIKMGEQIRNAGYDITEEIEVLENIYSQCQ